MHFIASLLVAIGSLRRARKMSILASTLKPLAVEFYKQGIVLGRTSQGKRKMVGKHGRLKEFIKLSLQFMQVRRAQTLLQENLSARKTVKSCFNLVNE